VRTQNRLYGGLVIPGLDTHVIWFWPTFRGADVARVADETEIVGRIMAGM
jgi:hypothetical protein